MDSEPASDIGLALTDTEKPLYFDCLFRGENGAPVPFPARGIMFPEASTVTHVF
ncbi:hypothetical protein GCM10023232_27110 [Sphingosinicella ginsenosidimutans]|uniref:hypothetical protein n=1 Tax=Allosphingosinicella ginsenosidimutans TaxID=1176539 RepID=UPI001FB06587|nr:hypothetical protein [Sphingosinicella ginsenosidimutans]